MNDELKKALEEGYDADIFHTKPCPYGYKKPCPKYPGYLIPCPHKPNLKCPYKEEPIMDCPMGYKEPCDKYPGQEKPCPYMEKFQCPYKPMPVKPPVSPFYKYMDKDSLAHALLDSYYDEMKDARYYEILADYAPTDYIKHILHSNMHDEKKHAEQFKACYYQLTGQYPTYKSVALDVVPNEYVPKYIKYQFNEELGAYEKYLDYYLRTCDSMAKEAFLDAMLDENKHALLLLSLL